MYDNRRQSSSGDRGQSRYRTGAGRGSLEERRESDRTFAVATDEALVGLITRARNRLVVIAPALTQAVADALSRRFDHIGKLDVTVILDADSEVYSIAESIGCSRRVITSTPFSSAALKTIFNSRSP